MRKTKNSSLRANLSVNRARQTKAMIEQFSGEDPAENERRGWQLIRRAAVAGI